MMPIPPFIFLNTDAEMGVFLLLRNDSCTSRALDVGLDTFRDASSARRLPSGVSGGNPWRTEAPVALLRSRDLSPLGVHCGRWCRSPSHILAPDYGIGPPGPIPFVRLVRAFSETASPSLAGRGLSVGTGG